MRIEFTSKESIQWHSKRSSFISRPQALVHLWPSMQFCWYVCHHGWFPPIECFPILFHLQLEYWMRYWMYGIGCGLLFQIFINCMMGNIVEISVGSLNLNSNSVSMPFFIRIQFLIWVFWPFLFVAWSNSQCPTEYQYNYRFFIERCQGPTYLTFDGVAPLNLEMFLQVRIF